MSRKERKIKRNFKVFCEGDTEYHYIDEMRQQLNLSIAIKLVNMKGGGYGNFLHSLQTDGTANCLAKFIIIDGDKAASEQGELKKLQELINYCTLQNKSKRIPHILIINFPDFEYIACLHTPQYKGQKTGQYIVKELGYSNLDAFKADSKIYTVLNTNGNSSERMLKSLEGKKAFIANTYNINKKTYEMTVDTAYDWDAFGYQNSNIKDYFEIINGF